MLDFDGMSRDDVVPLAAAVPHDVFAVPVGFFESFNLWHLNLREWLRRGPEAFDDCVGPTVEVLHHLCRFAGEGEAPGEPLGHALSRHDEADAPPVLVEIHPHSMQASGLDDILNDPSYDSDRWFARVIRVASLGVFIVDLGRQPLRERRGPERLVLLHSIAHFPVPSGTVFPGPGPSAVGDPRSALFEALTDIDPTPGITWRERSFA